MMNNLVALNMKKYKRNLEIVNSEVQKMLDRKERVTVALLAEYTGLDRSYFYKNKEARKLVEAAQLQQGECYNPKKVIFDRIAHDLIVDLKIQVKKMKKHIAELEAENEELRRQMKMLKDKMIN